MSKFSSFIVWTMLLNCLVIIQSSSPIVYRTSLTSFSSYKKISINKNANKIAIVDLSTSQITIFQKNIEKNSYTPTILNVNNFKPFDSVEDTAYSNTFNFFNKINLNNQGNMLYYVDTSDYLVMADISPGNLGVSTVYKCLTSFCSWAGFDDNIVVLHHQLYGNPNKMQLYHKGVKTNQKLIENIENAYQCLYYRQMKFSKDPFVLIQPCSRFVKIYNIDSSFSNIQNPQIFTWSRINFIKFLQKANVYFYNRFSSQIWKVACQDSLIGSYYQQPCLSLRQNLIRTKVNGNLQPPIAQNLDVGSELFISKNGNYFAILNNFPEKSVLKMYNLEEVTRVGSLNGVLLELQLTDSCQITNLQINQQGNKIVYICVKYLQKTELVVVEHTLGVYDVYDSMNSREQPNKNNLTISQGYNYMLFLVGFCFATFLLFLIVLCLIVLLIKYRKIINRIAAEQAKLRNTRIKYEKQIKNLKSKKLQISQPKTNLNLLHQL